MNCDIEHPKQFRTSLDTGWNVAEDALLNQKLNRLKEALVAAGVVRGERDKTVAAVTGYAEGSIRRLLSGGTPLTGNFIKAVCIRFNIRWKWITEGEEPMLARQGEAPYPDLVQKDDSADTGSVIGLSDAKAPAIAQPIAGMPYPYKIAGPEANVPRIAGPLIVGSQPVSPLKDIIDKIKRYFIDCGDSELVASSASVAFLGIAALPNHELIDFSYQLRKLNDGDSDKVATLAADEMFERLGIKPTTRIKLERIPVEPEEEKQEK